SSTPISEEGRISLAVMSAPSDATCIQVLVSGSKNVERDVDVMPGQTTTFLLEGLPEGNDTITVNAFSGSCAMLTPASVPTWIGDPVTVTVTPTPVDVSVTLHHNDQSGRVSIGVNFDQDGGRSDASAAGGAGGSGGAGRSMAGAAGSSADTANSGDTSTDDGGAGTGGGGT